VYRSSIPVPPCETRTPRRGAVLHALCCLVALLAGAEAQAIHLDIVVGRDGNRLTAGFCADGAPGCDSLNVLQQVGLPAGTVPLHGASGRLIFVTDFGDFAGGPYGVDDPGFFAGAGALPPGTLLRYTITTPLDFWDPAARQWQDRTARGERIRLAGGLTATAGGSCGLLICFTSGSTLIGDTSVTGALSLIIDESPANGSLHTHLDWFIEEADGSAGGSAGAYTLELSMSAEGFADSEPIVILFNRGLSNADFGLALRGLINATPPAPVVNPVVDFIGGVITPGAGETFVVGAHAGTASAPFTLRATGLGGLGTIELAANTLAVDLAVDSVFGGTLRGSGSFAKRGPGRLTLAGRNTHRGETRVSGPLRIAADHNLGAAGARLVLEDAVLETTADIAMARPVQASGDNVIDTGASQLILSGPLDGDGLLTKRGAGHLALRGTHPYAGRLVVAGGTLELDGFLAGDLALRRGATLGGDAAIGGRLELGPGSRQRLVVGPDGRARGTVRVGGDAHIEAAVLEVTVAQDDPPLQALYPVIEAGGRVHGRFAAVDTDLAFLEPRLFYQPRAVMLQLRRNDRGFADFASSSTETGLARALDGMLARGGDVAVAGALAGLSTAGVASALESLAGTNLQAIPRAASTQTHAVMRQLGARLSQVALAGPLPALGYAPDTDILLAAVSARGREGRWLEAAAQAAAAPAPRRHGAWLRGLVGVGNFDLGAGSSADSDQAGLVFGYDLAFGDDVTLGVFGAYSDAEINQDDPGMSSATTAWQAGAYGRLRRGALHVDALFGAGRDAIETSRRLRAGTLDANARADFDATSYNAYLELARTVPSAVLLQPYLALQWARQERDAYTEQGSPLALSVDAARHDSLRTLLGVRLRREVALLATGSVLGELRLAWARELLGDAAFSARLAGDTGATTFVVDGGSPARDSAVLGAGVVASLNEHAQAFADVDADVDGNKQVVSISVGVRVRW
jgi:outer membrane autotransporter protein